MRITAISQEPRLAACDLLVIPVNESAAKPDKSGEKKSVPPKLSGAAASLDKTLAGLLSEHIEGDKFEGKEGQKIVLRVGGRIAAQRIALMGAGPKPYGDASARRVAARATKIAREYHAKNVVMLLPDGLGRELADVAEACAEGALLGDYRFLKYKNEELKKYTEGALTEFSLLVATKRDLVAAEKGIRLGYVCSHATILARGLVNEPASTVTPGHLADIARALAAAQPKRLKLEIHDTAALKKMGAGGILGVAQGSDEPAYLIHLTYKPSGKVRRRVAVVGKGITFDSGGLSLKPAQYMEDMKVDMAGCAVMLGVMSALTELAPDVEVHGISAVCENMPSGKAVRPGDVITTMSGKTVEILNTDAEGRVTLADSLYYASKLGVDAIVDLATLTGSCMVALGEEYAGLMSNNQKLAKRILDAAASEGELLWQLPLPKEYADVNKSKVADLRNTGTSRYGDAIHAGIFLQEFVGETPWAHLDIAGPAHSEKDVVPHQPYGATGFGVRTVLEWIQKL